MPYASKQTLALAAALGHAPLLRLLAGRPLRRALLRDNAVALALTAAAMGAAWCLAPASARVVATIAAWALGHLLWSVVVARRVWRGRALAEATSPSQRRHET
jgi:hypothetical protein